MKTPNRGKLLVMLTTFLQWVSQLFICTKLRKPIPSQHLDPPDPAVSIIQVKVGNISAPHFFYYTLADFTSVTTQTLLSPIVTSGATRATFNFQSVTLRKHPHLPSYYLPTSPDSPTSLHKPTRPHLLKRDRPRQELNKPSPSQHAILAM